MSALLKWVVPVTRREGVEREPFLEFWRCIHAAHVANFAQPLKYCVTFFDRPASIGVAPSEEAMTAMRYDGLAELWFRDFDHFNDAFGEHRGGLPTIDGFQELIEPMADALFATEHVHVDAPTHDDALKWVGFVKRRADVPREALFAAWRDEHSPRIADAIARSNGACTRYTTSHADRTEQEGTWDGIASLWYVDAAAAANGLPPAEQPDDPFPRLIDAEAALLLQGRELTIVDQLIS